MSDNKIHIVGHPEIYEPFTLFWWLELRDRFQYLYTRDRENYTLRTRWMNRIDFINKKLEQYE